MHSNEYTADAICRAMNLPGFIDPSWAKAQGSTLRVVLKPSFHPELCLSACDTPDGTFISVVALTEQFWAKGPGVCLLSNREEILLPLEVLGTLVELFEKAVDLNPSGVYIDGMGLESCLVSREGTQQFGHPAAELVRSSRVYCTFYQFHLGRLSKPKSA